MPTNNKILRVKVNKLNVVTKRRKNTPTLELGQGGVELAVYDDKHEGDLIVTSNGITWCPGKTHGYNGNHFSWEEVINNKFSPIK